MPKFAPTTSAAAALGLALLLGGCNGETPPARVGAGAGPTDGTGAPSGRTSTQDEAKETGGGT